MNASSLLLRAASRRAASAVGTNNTARTTSVMAVRSASVLAGSSFQGAGFKAVGLRSLWSTSTSTLNSTRRPTVSTFSSSTRSLSFLSDYDAHVLERATLADGLGVAPKPLDAAQVATLIDEIKNAQEGDADADRVRFPAS